MQDDDGLMQRIAFGSPSERKSAMRILVKRHTPSLLRAAERRMGGRGDPEVMVSETFVKMWRGAATYQPRGRLRALLFTYLYNGITSELRRPVYRVEQLGIPDDAAAHHGIEGRPEDQPDFELVSGPRTPFVTELLRGLDGEQLEAFSLRFIEEFDEQDTCAILGIARSRLAYLIRAGRKKLQGRLRELDEELATQLEAERTARMERRTPLEAAGSPTDDPAPA